MFLLINNLIRDPRVAIPIAIIADFLEPIFPTKILAGIPPRMDERDIREVDKVTLSIVIL